jgi:hypothetical protein
VGFYERPVDVVFRDCIHACFSFSFPLIKLPFCRDARVLSGVWLAFSSH